MGNPRRLLGVVAIPEPRPLPGARVALVERPGMIRLAAKPLPRLAPLEPPPPPAPRTPARGDGPMAFDPRPGGPAVTVDPERAEPRPLVEARSRVAADCLERLAMLARHREERPIGMRPHVEARMLAQLDAIAAAGTTEDEVRAFCEAEAEDGDPFAIWAAVFLLGCADGGRPLEIILEILEALPEDGEAHWLAADALVVCPHPYLATLGEDLSSSPAAQARAAGIELLSRRGWLSPASEAKHLEDGRAPIAIASLRAAARRAEVAPEIITMVRRYLRAEDAAVAWEAARALTLWGDFSAYEEARVDGPLATILGANALELFVLAGSFDDLFAMQRITARLPATAGLLDVIARFGHPGAWAYLVHHLADAELAEASWGALCTIFGPLLPEDVTPTPGAVKDALARQKYAAQIRYRRGAPWSPEIVRRECLDGSLPRRATQARLDELRARGALRVDIDTGAWWQDLRLSTHLQTR
ncbi:hypothetical protein [Polyangium aurulentum]|uniref:hypothetical protein n=1 Tax=Polyangium aurulentum TaxID=2567896 RepID=UPI0010ADF115|nr:hypothetical protein [Polyangium aurulentum]UQA63183.1 hypothetical protein E8A73_023045 [Polyangium aurulentum]